ncbi:glutamate-5-semialdehyde dehydrogenase [Persicimonas caeni]|uniref:Gamma-glutamyl phosphate reductase n=1 Tax=Persicimonas caeni TaxID=2292766 RepID=A0A4Y6Q0W2_PERCE|nr:glutamate-5-semialdehyde dehydrogenase [Persicimonas caeni]QDG54228.1 glutamate-5-semialdehyde dehydrogenase [Persicimonas caeni]QED35449.1 glutamate-5-semialdehyde dehydrogenase [Persicimonas caeni]
MPDATKSVRFEKLHSTARRVRQSARLLAFQPSSAKNDALSKIATALRDQTEAILEANRQDLANGRAKGLDEAFLDRLELTPARIDKMASDVEEIIALGDPVGRVESTWVRPNGLRVGRRRIPLGVIGIIYESRPNVTSDAAALCIKSGNGVLLKGGSDAFASNRAVYKAILAGLEASALPEGARHAVGFVDTTDRGAVQEMLRLSDDIDVIIPRGGKGLIRFVTEHSRIPVIKHDEGVCHVVIDGSARREVVDPIVLNAKTQRPGVCNAMETLLVLDNAVKTHLGRALDRLADAGVKLHLCERAFEVAEQSGLDANTYDHATAEHYRTEFLSLELAVRVVEDLSEAIGHINEYGSHHTESLLTEDYSQSERFQREVDSSVVMINASTRFSDGNQLGLGAEIGISTTKMHAYGPMGIDELTTTKFVVLGDGQIRQ